VRGDITANHHSRRYAMGILEAILFLIALFN